MLYFRSKHNTLKRREKQLLQDLGIISGFKATSELPQWLNEKEQESLREFLESNPKIERVNRYQYRIDGRAVDFSPVIPIQTSEKNILFGWRKMQAF